MPGCNDSVKSINVTTASEQLLESLTSVDQCRRDSSLLFLILMLGTVWLGIYLHNFRTRYVKPLIIKTRSFETQS